MNILHVASIGNDHCSGVSVVVPEHVKAERGLTRVSFMNITNESIEGIDSQLRYSKEFDFEDERPDLVVFHEAYRWEYLALARKLRQKNIPYVIIPHGELNREAQRKKWLKKKTANLLFFNRFIRNAAAVQVLSQRELESTRHGAVKFVGTNGINIPERQKEHFNLDKTKLVYIGRLDAYHKGLDLMLDAAAIASDEMRSYRCTIDVYGPDRNGERKKLEEMIRKRRISDVVTLHGAVSGKKKESVLLRADAFIQTSRFEGMPMGILEALSYGLPCILSEGTTLGGFVEKEDAGWCCKGDAQSIAEAIKKAISSRETFFELSRNARESVKRSFSWETVAAETVNRYKKLGRRKNDHC